MFFFILFILISALALFSVFAVISYSNEHCPDGRRGVVALALPTYAAILFLGVRALLPFVK